MLFWQILIDGFAISSLYALGATGFTLIFGVTGVLNLSHGAIMVAAAVAAWAASGNFGAGAYLGAVCGIIVALLLTLATYYLIVRRLQLSRAVREEEKEIFILTATLLWGIMIQEAIAYLFTNNAKTVLPIVDGVVTIFGRSHARRTRSSPRSSAGRRLGRFGCSSIGHRPARPCSPHR